MIREILFRGKTIKQNNGVTTEKPIKENMWVYGNLTVGKIEGYKADMISNKKEIYYINSDTIGQFTGLTDKNGKKIFEGDILKIHKIEDLEDLIGHVIFYNGAYRVKLTNGRQGRIDYYERCRLEIIGNIYDQNPGEIL